MTDKADASVHASAVKVGDRAVLIRGPFLSVTTVFISQQLREN